MLLLAVGRQRAGRILGLRTVQWVPGLQVGTAAVGNRRDAVGGRRKG